jgi:hypothetical protein
MSWFTDRNTSEIVSRDRSFRVALRPSEKGDPREFDVEVKANTLWEMAKHGPVGLVANSHILNEATKLAPDGFAWWGDPITEHVH